MKRKRLRHCAYNVCDIFCGWEKYPDEKELLNRTTAFIEADVLGVVGTLDGEPYDYKSLRAANNWLLRDLRDNKIPIDEINSVAIELEFVYGRLDSAPIRGYSFQFRGKGGIISGPDMYEVPYDKYERYQILL